jgi:hypothetical protein
VEDDVSFCAWEVPDPLCCECWEAADPAMKAQAILWASSVMYARTGRQFGLCEVTVRPCMKRACDTLGAGWAWWGWSGSLWTPYIWQGTWYNCFCGEVCCCEPRCQVQLAGPVDSITEVTIGGVVVDPDTYRVDNFQWLVREGGECWPQCPNMDNPSGGTDVWEVTYMRGRAVPADVLAMTAILACEYVKFCTGDSSCRLNSRVTALIRQDVSLQFVAPDTMLSLGLTGIGVVDEVIATYNPAGLKYQPRVFSQATSPWPRQQTWP